jgi:hypothetical protein
VSIIIAVTQDGTNGAAATVTCPAGWSEYIGSPGLGKWAPSNVICDKQIAPNTSIGVLTATIGSNSGAQAFVIAAKPNGGGGGCSYSLDFSVSCNSQYYTVIR